MTNSKPVGFLNGALYSLKTNLSLERSSGKGGDTMKVSEVCPLEPPPPSFRQS
jgi:hypothetical protein